jgi:cytosine/adenosine deaminase-related metal-dependent hydrolase
VQVDRAPRAGLATIDAARIIGADRQTGSLTPGERADIIMVATDALNMAVASDPVHLVVEATRPKNVDTVICKQGNEQNYLDIEASMEL